MFTDVTLKSIFQFKKQSRINKLLHTPCACVTDHLLEMHEL